MLNINTTFYSWSHNQNTVHQFYIHTVAIASVVCSVLLALVWLCRSCSPVLAVLFWLSSPSCTSLAVLPSSPNLKVLCWQPCFLAALFRQSCPEIPVLAVLSWQTCQSSPVLAVLSWNSYHGSVILPVLSGCPELAVLLWLSFFLAALSFMTTLAVIP